MIAHVGSTLDASQARKTDTAFLSRPSVTLERAGQAIFITPPTCAPVLAPLQTRRHLIHPDQNRGTRIVEFPEPLVTKRINAFGNPCLACLAGLEPVVEHLLVDAGYAVKWKGNRPRPLAAPDLVTVREHGPVDQTMLDLIRQHGRGLIRYDRPGVDPAWLITEIALAYPSRKIAVIVAREEDVQRVARDLLAWLPDVCWATGRSQPDHPSRVVVSTFGALGYPIVRVWERDIVVVLDAVEVLGKMARYAIRHAPQARLYGLIDRAYEPASRDADQLVSLFGLAEVVIPGHGQVERAVDVVLAPIRGGPPLDSKLDAVTLKRCGVWQHPVRNRRIARLAESLVVSGNS